MNIFELTTKTVKSTAGDDTLPRAAHRLWKKNGGGVPVVDAHGTMTGVLITDRDIGRAWRAAHGVADGAIRTMSLRSADDHGDLDLIANDVSVFFLREDGVVQQRILEDQREAPPALGGETLGPEDLGAFMRHARTGEGYARRERSEGFEEHYRLGTIFWNGLSVRGREHLVLSARFELAKVESKDTWRRAIAQFRRVDSELARRVATGLRPPHAEGASVLELFAPRR